MAMRGEYLDLESLLVAHPGVGLPVGLGELLRFQVAALAQAGGEIGDMPAPHFVVRHIADPRELAMLKELAAQQLSQEGSGELEVGALVSTPLGVEKAAELAVQSGVLWLDAHRLMVSSSGYPAVVLTSAEPLDEYMRKGWLAEDPRLGQDSWQQKIFTSLTAVRTGVPDCQIGVRMGRAQSPELLHAYWRAGARIFIVEPEDLWVDIVELGKAALRQASGVEVCADAPAN